MLQASIQNVSSVLDVCCKCIYMDVAYVAVVIQICCKRMLQIFHLFETYVAEGLHVATYVRNKRSGRGWLAGTRRASTGTRRTTVCVGAPAYGGMCVGAAVAETDVQAQQLHAEQA
jgi:hypothetical protein